MAAAIIQFVAAAIFSFKMFSVNSKLSFDSLISFLRVPSSWFVMLKFELTVFVICVACFVNSSLKTFRISAMNDSSLSTMFKITFSALFRLLRFWCFLLTVAKPKKKNSCFRKCEQREKSSHGRPQIYLFLTNLVDSFK